MIDLDDYIEDDLIFEMSNVESEYTGLKNTIWASTKIPGSTQQSHHNTPRIKVEIDHELVPFSIDKENPRILTKKRINIPSKEMNSIKEFIIKNYQILIDYHNGKIGTGKFIEKLKENNIR